VQHETNVIDPPLKGIYVFAEGNLSFRSRATQTTHTVTFPDAASGGAYPFDFKADIDMVFDTATTIDDDDLLGYRE
jgi:hypothetical protein